MILKHDCYLRTKLQHNILMNIYEHPPGLPVSHASGVCVCVCVGKVEVREDHSEPTSCRTTKYAKFKLLRPSSLLWALTVAHLWTLTIEHFSGPYICTVFIHPFFLTWFFFHFCSIISTSTQACCFDSLQFTLFTRTLIERPFYICPLQWHSSILSWIYSNQAIWPWLPTPLKLLFSSHWQIRHSVLNAYSPLPSSRISGCLSVPSLCNTLFA